MSADAADLSTAPTMTQLSGEVRRRALSFAEDLEIIGDGVTITSVESLEDDTDADAALTLASIAVNVTTIYSATGRASAAGRAVLVTISGGTAGELHTLVCYVNLSDGQRLGGRFPIEIG